VSTLRRLKNEKNADYEERAMRVSSSFKEYYIFVRFNNKWILNNIKNEFSIIKDVI
jgi:hypothetical protein